MKLLEPIVKIITFIDTQGKQDWQKKLSLFLVVIFLFFSGIVYFIYQKSDTLKGNINDLYKLKNRSLDLINQQQQLLTQEEALSALLDKNVNFGIKSYFEKFCKDNNLAPDASWGDTYENNPIMGSEKFEEEKISPYFKELNTQSLLLLLDKLYKDPMFTILTLTITHEGSTLGATIKLTAKRYTKEY